MNTVKTGKEEIEKVLTEGVEAVYPKKESAAQFLGKGIPLNFYLGIDPTGPTLHLGHAIVLKKLADLQKLGHKIILLIGDFTATIGDPGGKDQTRKPLTMEVVRENARLYEKQAGTFLDFKGENPAELRYNSTWLKNLSLEQVLELGSHMTVEQMLKRDMFEERIKAKRPIFIHEFLYPLLQGYDSAAMEVDGEIGGNDQTFNMLVGRQLLKQLKNKEKIVITMKLLTDSGGKKMGKTEGNMVTLADKSTEMFGKIMSWTDSMIISGFELCTNFSSEEVKEIAKDLKNGTNPRDLKVQLAKEIVKIYHGDQEAQRAADNFQNAFKKGGVPNEIEEVKAKKGQKLADVLLEHGIIKSKSEFARLINEGAVSIIGEDQKIKEKDYEIEKDASFKIGKKRFVKVVIEKNG